MLHDDKNPDVEQTLRDVGSPMLDALEAEGITVEYLAKKLKQELNAKTVKTFKVKGAIPLGKIKGARGMKAVSVSGTLDIDREGNNLYGDGETIIEHTMADMGIRQKARQDAHRLRGDYAPEKHEVNGPPVVVVKELPPEQLAKLEEAGRRAAQEEIRKLHGL
jgi:predicted Fe-Mo cluster-binding NifX family protein